MAEDNRPPALTLRAAPLIARITGRLPLLITVALIFIVLAGFGQLPPGVAAAAIGVALLVSMLVPAPSAMSGLSATPGGLPRRGFPDAVRHFSEALPDPCIILDHRSVVVHRNAAAAREFPGIVEGARLAFALRFPPLLAAIDAARLGGGPQTFELHQTVPAETWHKVVVSPFGGGEADGEGLLVITMRTLTEERRVEQLRSDFVANASHELRTPLTSLVGFIDTLLGPAANDAEARVRFLTIMRSQAGRMSKLIDDLLSLSRIEMRQHLLPTGEVDVGHLLRAVGEALQPVAQASGLTLNFDLPAEPVLVTGDRGELHEVFENLLDNSIKYGADGGRVDVTVAVGATEDEVTVAVSDYGPGVDPSHLPRLTERFYRVDADRSRMKKGTGLGLAIVKHIVNRHRGQLSIRSRPGEGTRVEVTLRR